jgi:hypothetical protein
MASRLTIVALLGALAMACGFGGVANAAETDLAKTSEGVTVYLGVVPAEIVKGLAAGSRTERPMHGGVPKGPHEYHLVAAAFDAASGDRIANAVVTAEVSGVGLSGRKSRLEPMQISGTTTFGGFVNLPGRDLYTVRLTVERSGASPAVMQFRYDHRR